MNKEQTDLVGRLYALRAGLSAASQKRDNVDKIKKIYNDSIAQHNNKINELKRIIDTTEQRIDSAISYSSSHYISTTFDKHYLRADDYYKTDCKHLNYNIILLILFFIATIVFLVCFIVYNAGWLRVFTIIFCILTIISVIRRIMLYRDKKIWKKEIDKYKGSTEKEDQRYYDEVDKIRRECESATNEIPLHTQTIEKLNKQCSAHIAPYVAAVKELDKALVAKFKNVLDPRDWQNVDLIIYYFETGRADTLKEALHLVDNERQTQRIVNAIHSASAYVSQTIRSGMSELRSTMVQCFSAVSAQLNAIGTQQRAAYTAMYNQMQNINANIKNVSLQLGDISADIKTSFDFNKALAEKSTTSSDKLMADMNYMRGLAEEAEFRRRYS